MTEPCCEIDLTLGPTNPIVLSLATNPIQIKLAPSPVAITLIPNQTELSLTTNPIQIVMTGVGTQGPPGPSGSNLFTVGFQWNNVTYLPLTTIPAGKVVLEARVCLTTAFDGVGSALSIGDAANYERLLAKAQNAPGIQATFGAHPGISYVSDTLIYLQIVPGSGASQGSGVVVLLVQQ